MLHPLFGLSFGSFPIYQIMLCIGLLAGLLTLNKLMKRIETSKFIRKRIRRSFFYATILGFLGANIANWFLFENAFEYSLYQRLTECGYTFYFGMLCFFAISALLLRLHKIDVKYCLNMIIPSILIAQFWGRIGCSLSGCCWGKEILILGTSFHFPARELEAIFVLVMFFILHKRAFNKRFRIYLLSYSLFRFLMEFFRGDNRGAILGITFLSPTQIIAFFVIVMVGTTFILRPLLKLLKKEEKYDEFVSKNREGKYEPRSFSYEEPKGTKHPLKVIFSVLIGLAIATFLLVYFNPFNMTWLHNIRYSVSDAFSFIYDSKGTEDEIGETNGISVVDVSDVGFVPDASVALNVVKSYDTWAGAEFSGGEKKTLPNGNQVYIFNQTVNEKIVLGKTRALVTDKDNNALYMVGDAATLTYTNEILESYVENMPTVSEAFGSGVTAIATTDCWYDTGKGLVDSYHAILSDDGITPVLGAVIQKSNNQIICYTTPQSGKLSTFESNSIHSATDTVLEVLKTEDEVAIKQLTKKKKDISSLEENVRTMERALSLAFRKSDLTYEQFANIIESADAIAESIPNLNADLYREIIKEETKQTILNEGQSEKKADKYVEKVEKAFNKCGIRHDEDEVATTIHAEEREASFRHSMNYATDKDVFNVIREENKGVEITIKTDSPIKMDVYGTEGNFVDSLYIEKEETISLYPEDGGGFVARVSNQRDADGEVRETTDYKVSVKSLDIEESIPDYITRTLMRIEDSYNRSNISTFISMCAVDGEKVNMGDTLAASVMLPMVDSCASCAGLEDGLDSVKSVIAETLIPNSTDFDNLSQQSIIYGSGDAVGLQGFEFLKGTDLELKCFRYIETENGALIKAKMIIKMNGMELYNGFTFLQIEYMEDEKTAVTEEEELIVRILAFLSNSSNYYITNTNTDDLYAAFGDTAGNISSTSDLSSLYDMWVGEKKVVGDMWFYVKNFDEKVALAQGHSQEKVKGFSEYTIRHNLMTVKECRAQLKAERATYSTLASCDDIYMAYNLITDPVGTFADEFMGKNEVTDFIWTGAKLITDPYGTFMDESVDLYLDELSSVSQAQVKELDKAIAQLDSMVNEYYQKLNALAYTYIKNKKTLRLLSGSFFN